MAKTALRTKAAAKPKFAVRAYICLREKAHRGELPGVTKSSW